MVCYSCSYKDAQSVSILYTIQVYAQHLINAIMKPKRFIESARPKAAYENLKIIIVVGDHNSKVRKVGGECCQEQNIIIQYMNTWFK